MFNFITHVNANKKMSENNTPASITKVKILKYQILTRMGNNWNYTPICMAEIEETDNIKC